MAKDKKNKKDKKDKKDKKNKEVESVEELEYEVEVERGTKSNPVSTSDNGPSSIREMREYMDNKEEPGEIFFDSPIGPVQSKKGEKRTTWYFKEKGIPIETLSNFLCGTEINNEMYEKYNMIAPEKPCSKVNNIQTEEEEQKEKKKVKKTKSSGPQTLTQEQLNTSYTRISLVTILFFKQFGKKKQRKAIEEGLKKKATGLVIKDTLQETFEGITEADLFSIFEALEEA